MYLSYERMMIEMSVFQLIFLTADLDPDPDPAFLTNADPDPA
jgi:hypothetical protein